MIGIAVALLAMAGTAIAIYIKNLPVYQGTVPGVRVPTGNTITVTALWSDLEITPQTQLPVIEYFKRHKTSLANNLLKIEMSATPAGLVVRFETTDESMLIGVDPQLLPDVKKLIDQNKATWNESRKRELTQYAQEMCANIVKAQAGGTRVESLSMYRDSVALNALVRGLGRHCVAQATKSSHSCVFEDEEGKLYFVVPQLTSEIAVQEKMMEGRPRVLPPGFQIWATIPASTAATPHIEPPEPEEPAPATDDKQPKTEKPGAETEGETPPTDGEMKPEKAGDGKMMKPGMEKMMKK